MNEEKAADHQARAEAREARLRIEAHESLCAERWAQSRKTADETKDAVDQLSRKVSEGFKTLYGRDRSVTSALVLLLIGIVGFLFVKAYG